MLDGVVFAAVARGLLFYEKKVVWHVGVLVILVFLVRLASERGSITGALSFVISLEDSMGCNKDVFYYKVTALPDGQASFQVDMCFYSEFKVFC